MRYFNPETKNYLLDSAFKLAKDFSELNNAKVNLKIISDYIPLKNDEKLFKKVFEGYSAIVRDYHLFELEHRGLDYKEVSEDRYLAELSECKQVMISDDIAYFLAEIPGLYFFLGVDNGKTGGLHTAELNPDEKALVYGFEFFKTIVEIISFESII